MTNVWLAADAVANEMAKSPHLAPFLDGLDPQSGDEDVLAFGESVHALLVRYSVLRSQPMLAGIRVPHLPEFGPVHDGSEDVRRWLDEAQRMAYAFLDVVEFVRSRLPGYPGLLVPDLSPGAPRVHQDGFFDMRFPWIAEQRRAGLQLETRPPVALLALELPGTGGGLVEALGVLLGALRETTTWREFEAAHAQLGDAERDTAKALRAEYREAIKEGCLEGIAGPNAMRRQTMRRAELEKVRMRAEGALCVYFEAFRAVDELLDALAAFLTHRVVRGAINEVEIVTADWGPTRDLRYVRLEALDAGFRVQHEMVRIRPEVGSLGGVVMLRNITIQFGAQFHGALLTVDGWLLSGSGDVHCKNPS
jgi:hypothetical protein